jgi:ribosomal protein S18 acetylase RimI-like enzyme
MSIAWKKSCKPLRTIIETISFLNRELSSAMPVTIRHATEKDAALIADLSRQTFYETFAAQNTTADMEKFMQEQFTREALMAEVGAAGNLFLLAFLNEEPVGYARLRETKEPVEMELARIYALAAAIGKGVGKALMEASIALARAQGKQALWLGVWEHNQRAIRFYTAWGFEKVGEHDFRLGNDMQRDWIMQKKL